MERSETQSGVNRHKALTLPEVVVAITNLSCRKLKTQVVGVMIKAIKHWVYNQHRKYVWVLSRIGKQPDAYIPTDKRELYVITIAYNHSRLIEKQIELVKQHVKDRNYLHVVVDNSHNRDARRRKS